MRYPSRLAVPSGRRFPQARNEFGVGPALPIEVTPGTLVYVKTARFEYQGPATLLQIGVGWKGGGAVNFDHGANLIRAGDGGYGFSNSISLPNFASFGWVEVFFSSPIMLLAPAIGTNIRVNGQTFTINAGQTVDAWIWMYDVNQLGGSRVGPDTSFLVIDTDSGVVKLKSVASAQQVRSLDVEYGL